MTLFIYGPMQLDQLIPNITLVFLQNVIWKPKTGFSIKNRGFLRILQNSLGNVSRVGATTIIKIHMQEYLVKISARSDVIPSQGFQSPNRQGFGPGSTLKMDQMFFLKLLYIYGSMQFDELIPNITLVFLQNVRWKPKTGFSTKTVSFWESCRIAQETFHELALLP